jgi:hypothetical protein
MDLCRKAQTPPARPRPLSLLKQVKHGGVISASRVSEFNQVSARQMMCGEIEPIRYSSSPSLLVKLQQFSNTHLRAVSCLCAFVRPHSSTPSGVEGEDAGVEGQGCGIERADGVGSGETGCSTGARSSAALGMLDVRVQLKQQTAGCAATSMLESETDAFGGEWIVSLFQVSDVFCVRFLAAFW